ncbi:hypothetical protein GCM10007916_31420 [Psychromonas marina]|uniref:Extracellular solute-binding protein n=1 Tax=Psychromonas marina TaxID=88364 RepID=A0ABQ6E3X6_9GAMM|nr:hypothetical protein GCM10007916_31420 [Psychromonas marina]
MFAAEKIIFWNGHQHTEYMNHLVEAFEKKTGIEVELHQFLSPQLRDVIVNQANTEELPDMLYIPGDFVGLYKDIKLSPVPDEWVSSEIDVRVKDSGKVKGTNYGIPLFQGNHLMLFYNRSLVKQPILDWDQLPEQVATFSKQVTFPITWNYREMYWLIPFMSGFNAWPIDGEKITLNTPEMVDALNFYKQLTDDGLVDPDCDHDCSVTRFKAGQSAYMINGDWVIRDLEKTLGDDLGIAMLPEIKGKAMTPMFSSYVLAYPSLTQDIKKLALLKRFSLFAQDNQGQQIILKEAGLMPVNNKVLREQTGEQTENQLMVIKQMRATRTMPTTDKMAVAWSAMGKGFTRFMDHNYPAEKTVILMQRFADREVKRRSAIEYN